MGWKEKNSDYEFKDKCKSLCDQLADVEIQCLKNVDTAALEDGDMLCYHADSGTFTNVSKEDIFGQYDIYVDEGSLTLYELTLADNNADTPDIIIDMSGLPQTLCEDADFIASLVEKINTDSQNASQVPSEDAGDYYEGDNVEDILQEIGADCANKEDRLTALEAKVDNDTTYTLSAPVPDGNGNCITTLTGSDGSVQEIVVAKPVPETDGVHQSGAPTFDASTNSITFPYVNDADESPAPDVVVDLSALVSDPFTITGGENVIVTFDAATGEYVIEAIDTDTDTNTTSTLVDNGDGTYTHTSGDGSAPVTIVAVDTDTNVSAVNITETNAPNASQDGISFTVGVEEDGTTVSSSPYTIPYASETTEGLIEIASTAVVAELNNCRPSDDTRAVTPVGMDFWVSRGYRFDSADVLAYTNPCRKLVSGSVASNATGDRSHVTASTSSTASNTMSFVAASNGGQANGGRSAVLASSGAQANQTETFAGAVSGAYELNAQGAAALGYRNTVAGNEIGNGWSVALGTADSVIGVDGPSALYNFVLGGAQNSVDGNYSGSIGSTGADINDLYCIIQNSSDCTIPSGAVRTNILSSRFVEAPDAQTIVAGNGAGPAIASANRTFQVDVIPGDVTITGAFTAGFTFAGFGEKALGKIKAGVAVVFEGKTGVRVAKVGEKPDGITTKNLAICAGGGIDPDNSPVVLDEDGQAVIEEVTIEVTEDEIDDKATQKAKDAETKRYNKAMEDYIAKNEDEKGDVPVLGQVESVVKQKKVKRKIKQRKPNPDYDASQKVEVTCVEMLGRTFANVSGNISVGDYIGAGGKKVDGPDLGFRVLDVDGNRAFVLVK